MKKLKKPLERKFGVELEFFGVKKTEMRDALQKKAKVRTAFHSNRNSSWNIHDDGSIEAIGNIDGVQINKNYSDEKHEVASPKLTGKRGISAVKRVANTLQAIGALTNSSCGLHVHLDAADLSSDEIAHILAKYCSAEKEIDKWMTLVRRANKNHYCLSSTVAMRDLIETILNECNSQQIDVDITKMDLRSLAKKVDDDSILDSAMSNLDDRHVKVNLLSLSKHGTIEFRHHHGTLDATAITNWIEYLQHFVYNSIKEYRKESRKDTADKKSTTKSTIVSKKVYKNKFGYTAKEFEQVATFLTTVARASYVDYNGAWRGYMVYAHEEKFHDLMKYYNFLVSQGVTIEKKYASVSENSYQFTFKTNTVNSNQYFGTKKDKLKNLLGNLANNQFFFRKIANCVIGNSASVGKKLSKSSINKLFGVKPNLFCGGAYDNIPKRLVSYYYEKANNCNNL